MATSTKKTSASAGSKKEEAIEAKINNDLFEENEALKKQMETMQAQMEMLAKQIASNNASSETTKKSNKNIKFINLVPGTLVLKGNQIWKIEGQFNSRSFLESEARIIVNNMRNAVRDGYVYIADSEFIKENDLESAYTMLLSDEQLRGLLNKSFDEVVEIYKLAPKPQQEIIVNMIKAKKESGTAIDANILIQIGKLCGQDLIRDTEYEDEG